MVVLSSSIFTLDFAELTCQVRVLILFVSVLQQLRCLSQKECSTILMKDVLNISLQFW